MQLFKPNPLKLLKLIQLPNLLKLLNQCKLIPQKTKSLATKHQPLAQNKLKIPKGSDDPIKNHNRYQCLDEDTEAENTITDDKNKQGKIIRLPVEND